MPSRLLGSSIAGQTGLETRFETALDALWMAYQPIVRGDNGHARAYEALLRSEEPTLCHPCALLAAATTLGRRVELGRQVRLNIAETLSVLPRHALVFVSLDGPDFDDPELADSRNPLLPYALRVVFEITERRVPLGSYSQECTLSRLRSSGFSLAVGDVQESRLPSAIAWIRPEYEKLDISLVRNIHRSTTNQRLVQALVLSSRHLGREVVASGVEDVREHDVLLALGCELMQGSLFGRPLRPRDVRAGRV
jgi:EAL domain-containing protein (putative c-di-GMP-specific phosphodiesterase class I)